MKKMGRKFIAGTAFAITAAGLAACGQTPSPEGIYGPPSMFSSNYEPSQEVPEDVYGPPVDDDILDPTEEFEPSSEYVPAVYGPPEAFENTEETQK